MAATNYTPIQLYFSTTASAVPLAANLAQGELAINITDGKLYYEDNAGVVQVIATKGAGTIGGSTTQIQYNNAGALAGNAAMTFNSGTSTTTLTTLNLTNALGATYGGTAQSAYAQGDFLYASATNTLSKLSIGTVNYILTSSGSVPQWSAPSSIIVQTATNLAGGLGGSVPYQSAVDTTTFLAIGAANRVMTSSGTVPQWVTSLTGLTGVSSSSITNTSLTSGRVVVSTTGGAQADDADLTFDGTTLSAGGYSTAGLTTLVKTVKIGDSNFSGVAVFAAATPAKLYIGTGTVTDTTSAIGATNAVGAISSLAITPIAATNTSVTYTNAATLYIAGAPSAGTNVTLTNPYSLYVAAGDAYFGGTVTAGTVNLTTLDLTNLEVTNIKAKDGTAAMTIADSTGVVSFTANPVLSGGTANGVLYLNGSKSATSGSALTFDGANLSVGAASTLYQSRLTVAYSAASSNGPFIADNRVFGADKGGALWLGGQYNTAGDYRPFGGLVGAKETATDGSSLGYLAFYVNKNAADAAEVGRFNSSGSFLVGTNTPFNATADVGLFVKSQASISRVIIDNQNIAGTSSFEMSSYGGGWSLQVPGSATFVNQLDFKFGNLQRVRFGSAGNIGFGTQGTTADRLIDASFSGSTTTGGDQFGLVLNPSYPNTATSNLYNIYAGPNIAAGATITNVFGLYLEASNTVGSTITNKYGLYQAGSNDKNYFAGRVGLGTTNPNTTVGIFGATSTTLGYSIQASGWNGATHRLTIPTSGDTSVWSFNWSGSAADFAGYATSSISVAPGQVQILAGAVNSAPVARATFDNNGGVTVPGYGVFGTNANYTNATVYAENSVYTNYSGTIGMRYNVSGSTNQYHKGITGLSIQSAIARGLHIFNYDQDSNPGILFYPANYAGQTANPSVSISPSGLLSAIYGSYADQSLASSGSLGFQIGASASYNDNSAHTFSGISQLTGVIYVRQSGAGVSSIPFYPNAGAGIAYQWTALNPQTGLWLTGAGPTINFTSASSGGNSYSVVFNGGSGTFTITRTGGTGAYGVYVQYLGSE